MGVVRHLLVVQAGTLTVAAVGMGAVLWAALRPGSAVGATRAWYGVRRPAVAAAAAAAQAPTRQ